jgi:mycofactocin precursor
MKSRSKNFASSSKTTEVPAARGDVVGEGARGMRSATLAVCHGVVARAVRTRQNRRCPGGYVPTETLIADEEVLEIGESEELLVEEVSIDGLCGVY